MVNTLFRKAIESPITRAEASKRNPIEFLKLAMENYDQYKQVWEKAKNIIIEKYQFDGDAKTRLDKYFGQGIDPPFALSQLDKAIKEGMDVLSMDLGKIVREYLFIGNASKNQLIEYFTNAMELNEADAKSMAEYVGKRFDELTNLKKKKDS